jgi:hypothetical protein
MSVTDPKANEIAGAKRRALQNRSLALTLSAKGRANADTYAMYERMEEAEANNLLALATPVELGTGRELLPQAGDFSRAHVRDTLEVPNVLNAEASSKRLDLATEAGVFEIAVDAAESIEAKNSLEKMLAHQMALCHEMAFKLGAKAMLEKDSVEASRYANTAARLMGTFQDGLTTFQRLRSGGRQVVTVQHVNVGDGGQAVVAGTVKAGGRNTRGGESK